MRSTVKLVGIVGGGLVAISGIAALITGGPDTVIVGGWMTVLAGVMAIAGAVRAGDRRGLAALLMILAVLVAGLVAPGVIPALADSVVIFMAYLVGLLLLLIGAIRAFMERKEAPTGTVTGLTH